jgi:multimeric flavodoxin WrbA
MIKVLGIVGSPRKGGNTEILVNESLKAARSVGADTEIVLLSEKNIGPCDGCGSCSKTGRCKINDDFMEVFSKMTDADAIILSSPSYYESVTPHIKALIDRAGYYNTSALGRTAFSGKVGGAMVVARRTGLASAWCQILLFILSQKMIVPGIASFANAIGSNPGDVYGDKEGMEKANELGLALVKLVERLQNR